eukprot:3932069-Rhodomonas_salina.1
MHRAAALALLLEASLVGGGLVGGGLAARAPAAPVPRGVLARDGGEPGLVVLRRRQQRAAVGKVPPHHALAHGPRAALGLDVPGGVAVLVQKQLAPDTVRRREHLVDVLGLVLTEKATLLHAGGEVDVQGVVAQHAHPADALADKVMLVEKVVQLGRTTAAAQTPGVQRHARDLAPRRRRNVQPRDVRVEPDKPAPRHTPGAELVVAHHAVLGEHALRHTAPGGAALAPSHRGRVVLAQRLLLVLATQPLAVHPERDTRARRLRSGRGGCADEVPQTRARVLARHAPVLVAPHDGWWGTGLLCLRVAIWLPLDQRRKWAGIPKKK